jgi:hypothetical protein
MTNNSMKLVVDPYNWSYAENPDISETVYHMATAYMVIIGAFGIIGNTTILVAFFRGPKQVSSDCKIIGFSQNFGIGHFHNS